MKRPASSLLLVSFSLFVVSSCSAVNGSTTKDVSECSCGYYDASTKELFTESIIVYFNESRALPNGSFVAEEFEHAYERAWNAQFRQAARKSNLKFDDSSLQFFIDPSTPSHLVEGASIRTARRDIQYGSFRSLLLSPPSWAGGSALSMNLEFNYTQGVSMNLMNTNEPSGAWVSTIMGDEFPDRSLGINYTHLTNQSANPWNWTEYRMDWTKEEIKYYIAGNLTRAARKKAAGKNFPDTPAPLYFRHWSTGNFFSSQGPPAIRNPAAVGWVRVFFNSSLTSEDDRAHFNERCEVSDACSVDDTLLRGFSSYNEKSTHKYKQKADHWKREWLPILMACSSLTLSTLLVVHALLRRSPWEKLGRRKDEKLQKATKQFIAPPPVSETGDYESKRYVSAIWYPEDTSLAAEAAPPAVATPAWSTPGSQTPGTWTPWSEPSMPTVPSAENIAAHMSNSSHSRASSVYSDEDEDDGYFESKAPARTVAKQLYGAPGTASSSGVTSPDLIATPVPTNTLAHGTPMLIVGSANQSTVHLSSPPSRPLPELPVSDFLTQDPSLTRARHTSNLSGSTLYRSGSTKSVNRSSRGSRPEGDDDDAVGTPGPSSLRTSRAVSFEEDHLTMKMKQRKATLSGVTVVSKEEFTKGKAREILIEKRGSGEVEKETQIAVSEVPPTPAAEKDPPQPELTALPAAKPAARNIPAPKKRVDYLAGLIAISSLLVTAIHFCLTFIPATINPGAFMHYKSEIWAKKTIDSYLLNLIWIGPFLMTSTKFLALGYLKSGDLRSVAEKTVGRTSRLMVPIVVVVLLEYFLMDLGAVTWLIYLPSVTWSTWPFTVIFTSFANLISELLELMFLIPNAAPQITFNYCTGVLWTIPVQLQGSWQTILAVIMVREIKTPWKRFGFYTFCIVCNWYALSWGSYFYLAIMFADLEVTYKWRKWLAGHPFIFYPFLTLAMLAGVGGLSLDMTTQWTLVNYATFEYGVHPDLPTGLPIAQTAGAGYPQYYVPKLHGLVFSVGLQLAVELSSVVQKVLSVKVLQYVFPHIFTIYLIHGFVFWSLGSFLCVHLAAAGFPYWANLLIVATACYSTIAVSVPFLTPILDGLNHTITRNLWEFANSKPAPRLPTLYPFPTDLLDTHHKAPVEEKIDEVDIEKAEKKGRFQEEFGDDDDDVVDGYREANYVTKL